MIELRNVNKIFNDGTTNAVHALKDINLKIEKGEFLILLGSNGSGNHRQQSRQRPPRH